MNSAKTDYNLYKKFLKEYQPFYNVFFLQDLIPWFYDSTLLDAHQIRAKWQEYLESQRKSDAKDILNFYIHIPFCLFKCSYCMYYSNAGKIPQVDGYINRLIQQIAFFKDTFRDFEFSSLYIGGGTPSVLTEKQIKRLLGNLLGSLRFKESGEKSFECNPESITFQKLKTLRDFGFNRVSFGVQSLDRRVLKFAGREFQNYDLIKTVVSNAKSLGFEVNTDLMIGIRGDSAESIIASFKKLVEIRTDTITLYPFKPSERYLKKHFNNDYDSFNMELTKKARMVDIKLKKLEDGLGFYKVERSIDTIYSSVEPVYSSKNFKHPYKHHYDATTVFSYPRPCSLFALGTGGSSYIFKSLQYHDGSRGKEAENFSPKDKGYWAQEFSLADEMRYFILQQLSGSLSISQEGFKKYFDISFRSAFRKEIQALKNLGKIRIEGDKVFLPTEPIERFASAMLLMDRDRVIHKINSFFKNKGEGFLEKDSLDREEEESAAKIFFLDTKGGCNNFCIGCANIQREQNLGDGLPTGFLIKEMKRAKDSGYRKLHLVGGELTIQKNIFKLLEAGRSNFDKVFFTSNGRMFSYLDFAQEFSRLNLDNIRITLCGHDAKTHESWTRVPNSFEETVKGIKNLVLLNQPVQVNVLVWKGNYRNLGKLLNMVALMGVRNLSLFNLAPLGSSRKIYSQINVDLLSLQEINSSLIHYAQAFSNIDIEDFPACMFSKVISGRKNVHIFDTSCSVYLDKKGKLANFSVFAAQEKRIPIDHSLYLKPKSLVTAFSGMKLKLSACKDCPYSDNCTGVFAAYAKLKGKRAVNDELSALRRVNAPL